MSVDNAMETGARFGAHEVVEALVADGVDVFFANPGTSEIHLVAAIDATEGAHPVLCLFEGVATGAADGYARASGKPAAVLLHLGPGLANGLANLHNAYKARSPMLVLVGEHASGHLKYETPLRSDLDALAGYAAKQVFHMAPGDDLAACIKSAVLIAKTAPCGPVVVVANADVMWSSSPQASAENADKAALLKDTPSGPFIAKAMLDDAVALLARGDRTVLLLGGDALTAEAIATADRIAQKTGCAVLCETFNATHSRGAGVPYVERLPYFREMAIAKLAPFTGILLVGSRPPIAFFGSPGESSELTSGDAEILQISPETSSGGFLDALAGRVCALEAARASQRVIAEKPAGPLTPRSIWACINRLMPAGAVISDESGVTSVGADEAMRGAEPHLWMNLTGGSIGQGLPVATGAAVGCSDAQVFTFHGDGGAMYTIQSLWTQVRENSKVINLIFKNDRYAILDYEVKRHGLGPLGAKGSGMFELARPMIDWVALASGMGMKSSSVLTAEDLHAELKKALATPGPCLIEVRLAQGKPKK